MTGAVEAGAVGPAGVSDVLDDTAGLTCAAVGTATGALLAADTACLASGPTPAGAAAAADWAWLGGTVEAADPTVEAMALACVAASTAGAVSATGCCWAATGGAAAFVGADGAATCRTAAGAFCAALVTGTAPLPAAWGLPVAGADPEAVLPGVFADGALLNEEAAVLALVVVGACRSAFAGAALAAGTATGVLGTVFAASVAGDATAVTDGRLAAGEATTAAAGGAVDAGCLVDGAATWGRALVGAAACEAAEFAFGEAAAGDADFALEDSVEEVGAGTAGTDDGG